MKKFLKSISLALILIIGISLFTACDLFGGDSKPGSIEVGRLYIESGDTSDNMGGYFCVDQNNNFLVRNVSNTSTVEEIAESARSLFESEEYDGILTKKTADGKNVAVFVDVSSGSVMVISDITKDSFLLTLVVGGATRTFNYVATDIVL